ncbi:hypothetical protein Y032_0780g2297 [Ancylostoma ceylanicum]|uniref:FAM20 C-terminal domain-containing protein n=1 Tax=Ancylostoma ceylanicum TaxID=53326 RepID=A0A016WF14_9BILA|nr:hypothetical protein Y032_0780g2297 [Ancylostoma ceylanicum]
MNTCQVALFLTRDSEQNKKRTVSPSPWCRRNHRITSGNQDRHHYESFAVFENLPSYAIHLDNGRASPELRQLRVGEA